MIFESVVSVLHPAQNGGSFRQIFKLGEVRHPALRIPQVRCKTQLFSFLGMTIGEVHDAEVCL